jgi:hypothetical protein
VRAETQTNRTGIQRETDEIGISCDSRQVYIGRRLSFCLKFEFRIPKFKFEERLERDSKEQRIPRYLHRFGPKRCSMRCRIGRTRPRVADALQGRPGGHAGPYEGGNTLALHSAPRGTAVQGLGQLRRSAQFFNRSLSSLLAFRQFDSRLRELQISCASSSINNSSRSDQYRIGGSNRNR